MSNVVALPCERRVRLPIKKAAYLSELAQSLALPHDLVSHLDMQAATPTRTAA